MSPDHPAAGSKSRIVTGGALAAACVLLGGVLLGVWHFTRDEPLPLASRPAAVLNGPAPERLPAPPAVSQDYVGSQVCRECHHELWDRYQTHPMAQSMGRVQDMSDVENYLDLPSFTRGGRDYYVERQGDVLSHHERQSDEAGQTIYDQAVEVQYAIGSGKRGRSYVIDRGGLMFLSPISWYSEKQRWDLAAGYPDKGHQRFERRVVERCISCHAGRVAPDPAWIDHFQQPAILEFAIGCERCHGPGGEHVAGRRAPKSPDWVDPIINPSSLRREKRDSVCNQCHLQGGIEVLRPGRRDFDFRPGMHSGEIWSIVLSDQEHDTQTPKAVSQVQQMYESICSKRSAGRLACTSCHDPHYSPSESEKPDFYRAKCLTCHAVDDCRQSVESRQANAAGDSCVSCHMPRLNASDVPHTSQTDHRIRRHAGLAPDASRSSAKLNAFPAIFDGAAVTLSALEEARIRGLMTAKRAEELRSLQLAERACLDLQPASRAFPDDYDVADGLAICRLLKGDVQSAISTWIALIDVVPRQEQTLQSLALACQKQGRSEDALTYIQRLLAVNPWPARLWEQDFYLLSSLNRQEEAFRAGSRALHLDPSRRELYLPVAQVARSLGKNEQADQLEQTSRRLSAVE